MNGQPQKCKIVIGGVTIKDDDSTENYLIRWEQSDAQEIIKKLTIICPRSIENILTLDNTLLSFDKEVIVTRGILSSTEEYVFRGYIVDYNSFGGIITFSCADKLYQTTKKTITYSYDKDIDPSAGVISEILKDAINTYTTLIADSSSVQDSGTILIREKVICKSEPVYNIITRELSKPLNWLVYYNPITDKVNFEPPGFTNNSTTLETGVNIIQSPKWITDESKVYNKIELQGAEQEIQTIESGRIGTTSGYTTSSIQLTQIPSIVRVLCDSSNPPTTEKIGGVINSTTAYDYSVDATKKQIIWNTSTFTPGAADYVQIPYTFMRPTPIVVSSPTSIIAYGEKQLTIIKESIKSVNDARLLADALLAVYQEPIIKTTIRVTNVSDLKAGQTVRVIDNSNNIDDNFVVVRTKRTYPYVFDELEIVSNVIDVEDNFFVFIIKKLMNLDRQSKDDFESLIQVIGIENDSIYENRYNKVTKISITGTTGIYDSPAFGIWNTNTYEDTSVGSFILGHLIYGVLGTSQLGDGGRQTIDVFLENTEKRFVELFYDTEFKTTSGTTGDWDTTNEWLELTDTEIGIGAIFAKDLEASNTNIYKSCNISIIGTGLDKLLFYIGEYNGTSTTYTQVTLTGTTTSRTGTINLLNANQRGLSWKAEADGGTSVLKRLNIIYNK